jgi:hypothetical protein
MAVGTVDPTLYATSMTAANNAAQLAYSQAKLQGDADDLAFRKAQAALGQAMGYASSFGYAPGGNWLTWGAGGPTQPPAGTPSMGQIAQGQTLTNEQLANQIAISGVTGQFAQPVASQYTPGTVLTAPSTQPGMGPAYGIVNADGSVQMVTTEALAQTAAQRGTNAQALISSAQPVDWNTLQRLSMGPPTGAQTPTMQYQQQQFNQAQQAGELTGLFTDPNQTMAAYNARGQAMNGQTFASLPGDQQQFWLQYNQNDPTKAAQAWAQGTNQALMQAGYQPQNQQAPTLAMQTLYGSYAAPTAGQQTLAANEQAYTQWLRAQEESRAQWTAQQTAAQNYMDLLSRLRGPADWAQYQKVLGATPQGTQDLVRAAAGQYIPGGGATTGVQPQAANLNTFYNQLTGAQTAGQPSGQDQLSQMQNTLVAPNQMAPQTWNALTPSQQQMLLGVWESQGYSQDDAKALFNQSLPKYATAAPSSGSFRLQ